VLHGLNLSRRGFLELGLTAGVFTISLKLKADPVSGLTEDHEHLLDEIERRACLYFLENADPDTGLVRDRARMEGYEDRPVSSVAATGFGLSALCIGYQRGYLSRAEALRRVERTLVHTVRSTVHTHGFFPHFLDMRTGERIWKSEYSSIDTAWLLCGVLHCRNSRIEQRNLSPCRLAMDAQRRKHSFPWLDPGAGFSAEPMGSVF